MRFVYDRSGETWIDAPSVDRRSARVSDGGIELTR
jgi:hypothetical protein